MVNNGKILIVDDCKDMVFALTNVLKMEGYKIIDANNGLTAIKLARKEHPDAIIMDIRMPEMDGLEAMKQLREIAPHLPVILITAYGKIDTAVQAVKLGAYDYIVKPFDNEKIIITLRNALSEFTLKHWLKVNFLDTKGALLQGLKGIKKDILSWRLRAHFFWMK